MGLLPVNGIGQIEAKKLDAPCFADGLAQDKERSLLISIAGYIEVQESGQDVGCAGQLPDKLPTQAGLADAAHPVVDEHERFGTTRRLQRGLKVSDEVFPV